MSTDEQGKLDAYVETLQGRWTSVEEDPDEFDDGLEWVRQPVDSDDDFPPFLDAGHPFADRLWALPEDVQERIVAALEPLTVALGAVDEGGEEQDTHESLTVLAILAAGLPDELFTGLRSEWIAQAVPHWQGMPLEELKRHDAAQLVADLSAGQPEALRPLRDYVLPDEVYAALWGTPTSPKAGDELLARIEAEFEVRTQEDLLSALGALDDLEKDENGEAKTEILLQRLAVMPTEILLGLQLWILKRAVKEWQEMSLEEVQEHNMEKLLIRVIKNAKPRTR